MPTAILHEWDIIRHGIKLELEAEGPAPSDGDVDQVKLYIILPEGTRMEAHISETDKIKVYETGREYEITHYMWEDIREHMFSAINE